jgi:hypothetical protein
MSFIVKYTYFTNIKVNLPFSLFRFRPNERKHLMSKRIVNSVVASAVLTVAACGTNPGVNTPQPALPAGEAFLTASQIQTTFAGSTAYLKVPAGGPFGPGGELPFYYGRDGMAALRFPTGKVRKGTWAIAEPDHYCVVWSDAPNDKSCTRVSKTADGALLTRRMADNVPLPVLRIVAGNPEGL